MCHALKVLFHGFTAADAWLLIIELVVVVLIADERIRSWRHDRRAKQLLGLISKGEDLRDAVPVGNEPVILQEKWATEVQQWTEDATAVVWKYGPYARKLFQQNQGTSDYLLPPPTIEDANRDLRYSLGNHIRALETILGDRRFTAGWF
jgi:hypothetical protein